MEAVGEEREILKDIIVMGITSLHSCLVLGRDSNKELSSI